MLMLLKVLLHLGAEQVTLHPSRWYFIDGMRTFHSSMVNPRRSRSIYDMPLVFEAGNDPPVVYPPGTFRCEDDCECDETPALFDEPDDAFPLGEETIQDFGNDSFQIYDPSNDYGEDIDELERTLLFSAESNDNSPLYRAYDVFIHKDSNPAASTQFYVLHDFEFNSDDNIEIIPSRFAVVSILMVI